MRKSNISAVLPFYQRFSKISPQLMPESLQERVRVLHDVNSAPLQALPRDKIRLKFLTHNVAGPMVRLKDVVDLQSLKNGSLDSILSLQEVHKEDLDALLKELSPNDSLIEHVDSSNPVGIFSNENLTLVWAKDFTLQEKRVLNFDSLQRAGEHYLLTVIPRRIGDLELDLAYKLKEQDNDDLSLKPKVKLYESFIKVPLKQAIILKLFGCSDRENPALMTTINVRDKSDKLVQKIKHVNMHTPAFGWGWERLLDFTKFLDRLVTKQFNKEGKQKNTVVLAGDMNNIFPGEDRNLFKLLLKYGFETLFPFYEGTYGQDKNGDSVYKHDVIAVSSLGSAPWSVIEEYEVGSKKTLSDHRSVAATLALPRLNSKTLS
ncbi:MAG: hypothetical protein ACOYK1_09425 [Vampirovibrionia bacterium]|jgi:exonuclease III